MLVCLVLLGGPTQDLQRRRLVWDDFKGTPCAWSRFDAYTYWSVGYRYERLEASGEGVRLRAKVWNSLGKRSWLKSSTLGEGALAALLNHEQGHFDLGLLCALEFEQAVRDRTFGPDYRSEIRLLYVETFDRVRRLERAYDAETRHGLEPGHQRAWDRKLRQRIDQLWERRLETPGP